MILKFLVCLIKGHDWHRKQVFVVGNNDLEVQYIKICRRCTYENWKEPRWNIEVYRRKDNL